MEIEDIGIKKEKNIKIKLFLQELKNVSNKKDFKIKYHNSRKKYKCNPSKSELLNHYLKQNEFKNNYLENYLLKVPSRSLHGVIVVSVIMKPDKFSCIHNCSFCPSYPQYSKSYIPEEPTVQRGERNDFSGFLQVRERLTTLKNNGHSIDKLEIIILGGTFSCYNRDYCYEFINDIYYSANTIFDNYESIRQKLSLDQERKINETTQCKIIGLTLETRPDYISFYELKRFRSYGCTRVQLGVQSTNDIVLQKNNRGCYNKDTKNAIKLLLNNCFKVDIHIMPDLPYSTFEDDLNTMQDILYNSDFYADQYKIYPTMITEYTQIKQWYNEGIYKPRYENNPEDLILLCTYFKENIPRNKRINRLIRDFSNKFIEGGTTITNLRQVIQENMKKEGKRCKCIRCREIKDNYNKKDKPKFRVYIQKACGGTEYFLSYETCYCKFCISYYLHVLKIIFIFIIILLFGFIISKNLINKLMLKLFWKGCNNEHKCYGFLRLRIPSNEVKNIKIMDELKECALIRELHIYGKVSTTYEKKKKNGVQHKGFGKFLMDKALKISKLNGFNKVAVISGDGVKNYYRKKFGFDDGEYYLIKNF